MIGSTSGWIIKMLSSDRFAADLNQLILEPNWVKYDPVALGVHLPSFIDLHTKLLQMNLVRIQAGS
jgi:hypothetical protein